MAGRDRSVQSSHGRAICTVGLPAAVRGLHVQEEQQEPRKSTREESPKNREAIEKIFTFDNNGYFGCHCRGGPTDTVEINQKSLSAIHRRVFLLLADVIYTTPLSPRERKSES